MQNLTSFVTATLTSLFGYKHSVQLCHELKMDALTAVLSALVKSIDKMAQVIQTNG